MPAVRLAGKREFARIGHTSPSCLLHKRNAHESNMHRDRQRTALRAPRDPRLTCASLIPLRFTLTPGKNHAGFCVSAVVCLKLANPARRACVTVRKCHGRCVFDR
jgi:hypothetical protein